MKAGQVPVSPPDQSECRWTKATALPPGQESGPDRGDKVSAGTSPTWVTCAQHAVVVLMMGGGLPNHGSAE